MIPVRSLTEEGLARFSKWILDRSGTPPREILLDDAYSDQIDQLFKLDPSLKFETSFALGKYLYESVFARSEDRFGIRSMNGVWAWISLVYIDSLVSKRGKNAGKPLALAHYIDTGPRLAYRLIARTAWELNLLHQDRARIGLSSTASPWGELSEQMAGANQRNFSNRAFWLLANDLYVDADGNVRAGAASKRPKDARTNPNLTGGKGAIRRLAATMKQFERTYDVRAMTVDQLVAVLPSEYQKWISASAVPA